MAGHKMSHERLARIDARVKWMLAGPTYLTGSEGHMNLGDFKIGREFMMGDAHWRCTDVGSRVVVAIKLDHPEDKGWYDGPPYAVAETVIDEHDMPACEPR